MERTCFTFEIYPAWAECKGADEIWPSSSRRSRIGLPEQPVPARAAVVACVGAVPSRRRSRLADHESTGRWGEWFKDVIVSLTERTG
jgi:hypothetical protein